MRKTVVTLTSIMAMAAMMTFTSCNKEEQGVAEFTATMESCTGMQGKTVLSGTNLNWVSGDRIAVYGTGGNGIYSATPQSPATTASFSRVSGGNVTAPCRAYYPSTLTTDGVNITLPAAQIYEENSIHEFPMYAESNTNTLAFRNLCGALKLHLTKANVNISTIAVTATSPINGSFTVNYNNGDPVLTPFSGSDPTATANSTAVLTCTTAQAIDNGADFYIYLPAGNYTDLQIELNTDDSRYCIKTANTTIPVTRSQYTTITLGENDLNFITPLPQGALPSLFSVSATQQVYFSQGNLQYQASTQTWRFAEHQYDRVGYDNSNISATYSGWIDLFSWGTGNNPTNTSTNYASYSTFVDWGVNAVSNGGNQANLWRTLTNDEWYYLFNTRPGCNNKFGTGNVNGVGGMIVLPDTWTLPEGCLFTAGASSYNWTRNNYTLSQWESMENAGAIFLPASGERNGTSISWFNTDILYWSSTSYDYYRAYHLYAHSYRLDDASASSAINRAFSVRLVCDNH